VQDRPHLREVGALALDQVRGDLGIAQDRAAGPAERRVFSLATG